ncbi:hypothetical protein [Arcobacter roscoffensis]|uniref:SAF domain-containing protein n=1 Tax=Arcobacter roscoffensis TaxID=2961520 RepID=A0ABY5E689_9BACT|nr:hypothetical protein [Arcobacter roscoffensis]UTJ06233.1 hypothetical protein NJU99_13410 [Arcobacter roscoffensis]
MQANKQIIIILILASLLFSALGAAFYFFKKNKQAQKSKNELVTIYIAKADIPKGTLITVKQMAQTKIAKQFLLNKPLMKKEIIGKYTSEKIFKNEMFLKQKLSTQIERERAKVLDFTSSSYNMKFDMFDNPNYTLVQGDFINIISVLPKGQPNSKGKYLDFDVQYVAKNIKVLGFIKDGLNESSSITKEKIKKVIKKKVVEELVNVKANELILDINPNVLISLIKDYNKGNQLWMVKTKESIQIKALDEMTKEETKELKKEIKKSLDKETKKVKKAYKPKVYKYQWYKSKVNTITKSAVIDYTNDKGDSKTKKRSVEIKVDSQKICNSIKDKFIIGTSARFYIRNEPTTRSSKKSILEKNTIIPYVEKLDTWYRTCDGQFVSSKVANEISYSKAVEKAGKR